jgi:hypothetical protein
MEMRFVLVDVKSCAGDLPRLERFHQGLLVHYFAARRVDEKRRGFHPRQFRRAQQVLRFGRVRNVQADEI